MKITGTFMHRWLWTVLLLAAASGLCQATNKPPAWTVVQRRDAGTGGVANRVIRWEYRVTIPPPITQAALLKAALTLVEREKSNGVFNAVAIYFFLPDTDTNGLYTAGWAVYAPDGMWERAGRLPAGDYAGYMLAVGAGNALVSTKPQWNFALTESQKAQLLEEMGKGHEIVYDDGFFYSVTKEYPLTDRTSFKIQVGASRYDPFWPAWWNGPPWGAPYPGNASRFMLEYSH